MIKTKNISPILGILILLIISGGAYYYIDKENKKLIEPKKENIFVKEIDDTNSKTQESKIESFIEQKNTNIDIPKEWIKYTDGENKYSFYYPQNSKIIETNSALDFNSKFIFISIETIKDKKLDFSIDFIESNYEAGNFKIPIKKIDNNNVKALIYEVPGPVLIYNVDIATGENEYIKLKLMSGVSNTFSVDLVEKITKTFVFNYN